MKRILALLMVTIMLLSLSTVAFAGEGEGEGEGEGDTTATIIATIGSVPGGTVSGGGTVTVGEPVTLTASAYEGYTFVRWVNSKDTEVCNTASYTFTVVENDTFYAQFIKDDPPKPDYTISVFVGSEGGGTVSGGGTFAEGTEVTLTAAANEGYQFVRWVNSSDVEVDKNLTYSFTATENATYYAQFTPIQTAKHWVVTSVKDNVGGYASAPGQYEEGASVSVTATAQSGYVFDKWIIDGADKAANPYSFTMSTTDVTAVAVFKLAPATDYSVGYYPGKYCSSTATYKDTKIAGAPLTLLGKMYSRDGYVQTGWCTDPDGKSGTYYPLEGAYKTDADIMLFPYWTKTTNVYTVTVRYISNSDAHGYISDAANNYIPDGATFSISAGESHSFTVHTDPGYYAYRVWTEGATASKSHGSVYNGGSFSVVNPSENKILYVRFENARYYPPTGDDSSLGLFAALALTSVFCLAATVIVKKHEH